VQSTLRHVRVAYHCARNCLLREMAFRGNFILRTCAEMGWLALLLTFFWVLYGQTRLIAGWSQYQVLFLIGTHFLIATLFNALFFENCLQVSERVRTGQLDFVLLKPVDPQFLLSVRQIDFSSLAKLPFGGVLIWYALRNLDVQVTFSTLALYAVLVACGVLILYSIMFMLATTSFWLIRTDNIFDLWWYVNSFSRYPAEIYDGFLGGFFRTAMTYVVPVLIVANVPAAAVVRATAQPTHLIPFMLASTLVLLTLSRVLFRFALRSYRSASS